MKATRARYIETEGHGQAVPSGLPHKRRRYRAVQCKGQSSTISFRC